MTNDKKKTEAGRWGFGWFDILVVGFWIGYSWLIWQPLKELPLYWNGAILGVNGSLDLIERGFRPLTLTRFGVGDFPLMQVLVAWIWRVLGQGFGTTRLAALPGMVLLIMMTYLVGKRFSGKTVGLVASVLVGFSPLVVAGLGMVEVNLYVAGLMMLAVWWWSGGHKLAAMATMAVAVVVSMDALVWLAPFVWWTRRDEWREKKFLLIPIGALLVWKFYVFETTGNWFGPKIIADLADNVVFWVRYLWEISRTIGGHMRWLWWGAAILAGGYLKLSGRFEFEGKAEFEGLLLGVAAWMGYYWITGGFEEMKVLLGYPMMIVASVMVVDAWIKTWSAEEKEWYWMGIGLVVAIIWLSQWRPSVEPREKLGLGVVADLRYQDATIVGRQLASYLELVYPEAKVYGGFPESYQLTQPHQGYITRAMDFAWCEQFDPEVDRALVVVHLMHESQIACKRLVDKYQMKFLQEFEHNGQWVRVYEYQREVQNSEDNLGEVD